MIVSTTWPLYLPPSPSGKILVSIEESLAGPQSRLALSEKRPNYLSPLGLKPRFVQLVTYFTISILAFCW